MTAKNILGRLKSEPYGLDRWYGFSVFLPEDWHANPQNEVVAQWHASADWYLGEAAGRGPPLALRIVDRRWYITFGWEHQFFTDGKRRANQLLWTAPYEVGVWTDWVFHVRWSYGTEGLTEVWSNGEKLVRYEGPNCYNDLRGVYLKVGIYHPGESRTLYIDHLRIAGETGHYDSVAP